MPSPTEEIKSRLDLVDFIKEFVTLTPAGSNWRARCPFHQEKTPSFMVSRTKQMWHCFGCGEGGDHFTFLMKLEGLEFPEVLRMLAQRTGVVLTGMPVGDDRRQKQVGEVLEAACQWFEEQLKNPEHAQASEYLRQERKLSPSTIGQFRLGFAPLSWDALSTFLAAHGFSHELILASGLMSQRQNDARSQATLRRLPFFDRFRGRIMFPIRQSQGSIVGFGGRILERLRPVGVAASITQEAKYLNTPQTALYDKSKVLYGLDTARSAIRERGFAVVVEGYMDVIGSTQAGVAHVVATSGTALTREHIQLLGRYTSIVALAFDEDRAGQQAMLRGIDLLLASPLTIECILWSREAGKDADECARLNPDLWRQAVENHKPFLEVLWKKFTEGKTMTALRDQEAVAAVLFPLIGRIQRPLEYQYWVKRCADTFGYSQQKIETMVRAFSALRPGSGADGSPLAERPPATHGHQERTLTAEERLVGLLALTPEALESILQTLEPIMFDDAQCRDAYTKLIVRSTEHNADLDSPRASAVFDIPPRIVLGVESLYEDMDATGRRRELLRLARRILEVWLRKQLGEVQQRLGDAEYKGDTARVRELLSQAVALSQRLAQATLTAA